MVSGKFSELTQKIQEKVAELDYVLAFWVHGSRAVAREKEDSDINYAFLVKKRSDYMNLKEDFGDLIAWRDVPGPYPEQQWEVAVWKEKKWTFKDIGWQVMTPENLKPFENLFSAEIIPHKGERWVHGFLETHLLRHQGEAQNLFIHSHIIYDPQGIIETLKKNLQDYPEKVSNGVKNWALARLRKRMPWHGKPWIAHDRFQFMNNVVEDLHYIAIAHYAINGRFPLSDLRHYEKDLDTLQPKLKKELLAFVAIDDKDKTEILRDIMDELDKERE